MQVTQQELDRLVNTIVESSDPERIYLFGSMSRGETHRDSDLDLLIVEKKPFNAHRSRHQEISRIRRVLTNFRFPKDIVVYSSNEVEEWQSSQNHLIGRCMKEGKLLYERR